MDSFGLFVFLFFFWVFLPVLGLWVLYLIISWVVRSIASDIRKDVIREAREEERRRVEAARRQSAAVMRRSAAVMRRSAAVMSGRAVVRGDTRGNFFRRLRN